MAMRKKSGTRRKATLVARFKHPTTVEIIAPAFVPLAALKMLDVRKLSKGSHTVEVGFLEGGCCPKLVRAVIHNGIVTKLDVEACEDSERVMLKDLPRDVAAVVAKAKREVGKYPWKPIPLGEFVAIARQTGSYPPRWGIGVGCFYICFWHYCLFCCWYVPGFCWIERRKPDVEM
jgi:hypothetical protein